MRTAGEKWSEGEVERIRSMIASGASQREICDALGTTEGALSSLCSKRGMRTHRSIPHVQRERIRELAAQGWSPARIARRVGVTVEAVAFYSATPDGERA